MYKREEFIEELKLRKLIREAILHVSRKKQKEQEQALLEEQNLRKVIRKLILVEKEETEKKYASSGINKLARMFKDTQILKTLKDAYKDLTTSTDQRESFRAHIVNGIENLLAPFRNMEDSEELAESDSANILGEEESDININIEDEPEMIGDDGMPVVDTEEHEEEPSPEDRERDDFTVSGLDQSEDHLQGRNDALEAFKNIEKQIQSAYTNIENEQDREKFYEWLLTNIKMYFDRWEEEMLPIVQEPTTPEYESGANQTSADQIPSGEGL